MLLILFFFFSFLSIFYLYIILEFLSSIFFISDVFFMSRIQFGSFKCLLCLYLQAPVFLYLPEHMDSNSWVFVCMCDENHVFILELKIPCTGSREILERVSSPAFNESNSQQTNTKKNNSPLSHTFPSKC